MKHFLLITILMSAISFTPIFATGENKFDNPNNDLFKRTALFAANGIVSITFGYATGLLGIDTYPELERSRIDFRELHDANKAYNFALKKEKSLTSAYETIQDAISDDSRSYFKSEAAYDTFIQRFENCEDVSTYKTSSNTHYWKLKKFDSIRKFSASSKRTAGFVLATTSCAYGAYWFAKNAYSQLRSNKE